MLAAEKLETILEMPEIERQVENNVKTAVKPKSVPKAKFRPRFYKLIIVGMIGVIFGSGVYFCSVAAGIATKGYELNKLKTEVKELAVANERIRLDIAKMDSLERVEAIALAELGMRKPLVSDYLLLADSVNWGIKEGELALSSIAAAEIEIKKQVGAEVRPLFQQKAATLLATVVERGKS